jgi:DNA transformation protein and related proteins
MPKPHSEFVQSLLDLLAPLGGVSAKRMFGGSGFYKDGLMFGLVALDKFFLKVDEQSKPEFEALGLEAFTYTYPDGRTMVMSYHVPPEESFNSPTRMKPWAARGWAAAQRAAAAKGAKRKKKK